MISTVKGCDRCLMASLRPLQWKRWTPLGNLRQTRRVHDFDENSPIQRKEQVECGWQGKR